MIYTRKVAIIRIIIGTFIGVMSFFSIYGMKSLNIHNDNWILSGYAEWDVQQHYAGWLNYNNSDRIFPIGDANKIGYPVKHGVNISFTDSIPLLSVFFREIGHFIDGQFQWFGIYELLVFILQGISAVLLLGHFELPLVYSSLGTVLFTFSPIMIERSFRHIALSSHYIIIFSLCCFFMYRGKGTYPWLQMSLLSILSVGITPYFLPMVMLFVLGICVENIINNKSVVKSVCFLFYNVLIALLTAYSIGSLFNGYNSSRGGYGFYSMNLNSIINPVSCGGYKWSQFLPVREQIYGHYDGFNYLGLGVIGLIVVVIIIGITWCKQELLYTIRRNIIVVCFCIFLTVFAVSNVICWDGKELIAIHLPDCIKSLCGIFRASSRLFYPVYYIILLFGIVFAYRFVCTMLERYNIKIKQYLTISFLVVFVCIQMLDLGGLIFYKHKEMTVLCNNNMHIPEVLLHLNDYDVLFVTLQTGSRYQSIISGYNNIFTNGIDANTRSDAHRITDEFTTKTLKEIDDGILHENYVYSTRDRKEFAEWQTKFGKDVSYAVWDMTDIPYSHIWEESQIVYFMMP